jgi:hypothetical protein
MQLLSESDSSIVVGQFTASLAVLGGKRNTVVDIEDTVAAARGPDGGSGLDAVLLGVDLTLFEGTAAREGRTGCLLMICLVDGLGVDGSVFVAGSWLTYGGTGVLREVVSGDETTSDTFVETGPAVVGSINHGVLETTRVCEVQVQLAVLALVGSDAAGANVGLELIEAVPARF